MQQLNDFLITLHSYFGGNNWFVYLLLGTGLFFTFYLKFPQIRYFRHAIRIIKGKYDKDTDKGDTSHFQALATALSGTVGTGNIAGVAFHTDFSVLYEEGKVFDFSPSEKLPLSEDTKRFQKLFWEGFRLRF